MKKNVLVLGGGPAGLSLACSLAKFSQVQVTLVDKNFELELVPFGYVPSNAPRSLHSKTRVISRKSLSFDRGFEFIQGNVESVDDKVGQVVVDGKKLTTDILVLALGGAWHAVVQQVSAQPFHSWSLGATDYVAKILEQATVLDKRKVGKKPSVVAIAGGGLVGVQTAVNFRLYLDLLCKNIGLRPEVFTVKIIEKTGSLLHLNSSETSEIVKLLRSRQVDVELHKEVFFENPLEASSVQRLDYDYLLWAGYESGVVEGYDDFPWWQKALHTNKAFQVRGFAHRFAIGDQARPPVPHRLLSWPEAVGEGRDVAQAVWSVIQNKTPGPVKLAQVPKYIKFAPGKFIKIYRGHASVSRLHGFSALRQINSINF